MKKVIMYIAEDGKQFTNEDDCIFYEKQKKIEQEKINNLILAAKEIQNICHKSCDVHRKDGKIPCADCPFWESDNELITMQCPFTYEDDYCGYSPVDWGLK